MIHNNLFAQMNIQATKIKILKIEEHESCYVLYGLLENETDTLYIVSTKQTKKITEIYEKIACESSYIFNIIDTRSPSIFTTNFVYRIGKTVVWKTGNEISKYPLCAENIIGLYIRKRYRLVGKDK